MVLGQLWEAGKLLLFTVNKRVLRIEEEHARVIPERLAQTVDTHIALRLKEVRPVIGPLLIDVALSALPGDGRREDDHVTQRRQIPDKRLGTIRLQMLCYLKGYGQIVPPLLWAGDAQIGFTERFAREEKLGEINPRTINAANVLNAALLEYGKPMTPVAANIDHTTGARQIKNVRHHGPS